MATRIPVVPLGIVALLALGAGCRTTDDAAPTVVTITATDFAFDAPDTISAGLTTFRLVNGSDQLHMAQLIKLDSGRTPQEFLRAYGEAFRTAGPRPAWAARVGGPGAADPHYTSNATQVLEPGSYLWICLINISDGIPHVVKHAMAKSFTVRAGSSAGAPRPAPAAGVVIRLLEYSFDIPTPLTAGRQVIRVENRGAEPHEVALVKLHPGTTIRAFEAWLQNPAGPPPITAVGGVSSLAPSLDASFEADLTAGDYVILCFVTAPDGRPHTAHGMIRHFRVDGTGM